MNSGERKIALKRKSQEEFSFI